MDIFDYNNRNEFLEIADEVIAVPNIEDAKIRDPEIYMKRLSDINTPRERLIEFFKSQFDLTSDVTHEVVTTRMMGFSGLMFGWLLGGLSKSRHIFEDFQRQHNASVFDNEHRARRLRFDNYVYNILRRGAKYGVGSCLLCYSVGLIGYGSISYRNRLYMPDWLVGFGTLGAITRCFLGLRGVAFGTGLGLLGGTFAYGFASLAELGSGKSVAELRYLNHMEYIQKRQARLNRVYKLRSQVDQEKLSKIS
uniref:Complex I assembly factor TIMMDC1, mitochondrial n=1 Tax=Aceria tosichella TaxID=561515 RepID=A0A6G1SPD4_9ACAR